MSIIQSRIDRVTDLKKAVKEHCMCLYFSETPTQYQVLYPDGYYPDGVRIDIGTNKAKALEHILSAMEKHWNSAKL